MKSAMAIQPTAAMLVQNFISTRDWNADSACLDQAKTLELLDPIGFDIERYGRTLGHSG